MMMAVQLLMAMGEQHQIVRRTKLILELSQIAAISLEPTPTSSSMVITAISLSTELTSRIDETTREQEQGETLT